MQKTILVTGSTDGIGLEASKTLAELGHVVLLHGRNSAKLEDLERSLSAETGGGRIETYLADFAVREDVEAMAKAVIEAHGSIDVLINNAGVYSTSHPITADGLDARFAVNTVAPYLLTKRLLPLLGAGGRVVNLSSAAQSPVDPAAVTGRTRLSDGPAYAQSKLALTMWSRAMAQTLGEGGPAIIAVNPGSLLATNMVRDAFGVPGADVRIGADILVRAALADEFESASGKYFDNDKGRFGSPHPDALDLEKCQEIVDILEVLLDGLDPKQAAREAAS
ncbi:MAG: SDR family NAD(P)-dependent oxidoreductase [Longimicrobiales bacterium]